MKNASIDQVLKKVEIIFFDFDGVIVESVHAKAEAFKKLYEPYGKGVMDLVAKHHLSHGGVSRYEKIRYYHEAFLGQKLKDEEVFSFAKKFSVLVEQEVVRSEFVSGILSFLDAYYKKKKLYIVSATPEPELKRIVSEKNLAHYFSGVFGSPASKKDVINRVLQEEKIRPEKAIMFGDAVSDYEAANLTAIYFIARTTSYNKNEFLPETEAIVDFIELANDFS